MSSPLAHGLVGLSIARLGLPVACRYPLAWYLFGALSADVADFDFLPGFLQGNINKYHHGASHSIGAACLFGAVAAVVLYPVWRRPLRVFLVGGLAYLSHVVVDLFCAIPGIVVVGVPLFWPYSDARWKATWQPFLGIHHGSPGDALATFFERVACWHNASALGRELLAFLPLTLLVWLITSHLTHRHAGA